MMLNLSCFAYATNQRRAYVRPIISHILYKLKEFWQSVKI